jgi:hypothetical protein
MLQTTIVRFAAVTAIAVAVPFVAPASADELADVYARIVANPVDTELNLQYALLAEGRGEYRKALAAYERILVNDPANEAARNGLQRVRRIIEPPVTLTTLEAGAVAESNPLHLVDGDNPEADVFGFGRVRVRDERPLGSHRWRTTIGAYGEIHARESELNYANADIETGPLIDLEGTMMAFRPALGGGASYFDGRFYYWDVNVSGSLEGYLQGAHQWIRLRTGYRDYDPSFSTEQGFYADLTGRLALQDVIHPNDVFSISPKLRWSGIEGLPQDGGDEFAPGLYTEAGATFEYSKVVNDAVTAAVNFRVNQRWYEDIGGGAREDLLLSPGAALVFTGALGPQADVKLDYRYEWNDSNDADHDWQNHVLKIGVSVRR